MPLNLSTRNKNLLGAGIVLALGMAVGVSITGNDEPTRQAKLDSLGSALAAGSAQLTASDTIDTAEYHRAVIAVREGNPNVTDLLSAPVEPGAVAATEVMLPYGARVAMEAGVPLIVFTGAAAGKFTLGPITYDDRADKSGTLLRVTATSTATIRTRMSALVQFTTPVGP